MKKAMLALISLAGLMVMIILGGSCYTVNMYQQVIVTRFQAPVGLPVTEPGLHWKTPFIEKANYFDKRWLEWESEPTQIPTLDKKYIWVDIYARWRISDALLFFKRVRDEEGAQTRLDDTVDGEARIAISNYKLIEIVRTTNREFKVPEGVAVEGFQVEPIASGREKIMKEILDKARVVAKDSGIELVDIRIKRIDYIPEVRAKVFDRMISERKKIAQNYRSEGKGESEKILGDMEKELRRIDSEAYKTSQEKIGAADAEAARIYAEAYGRDPEFYAFWKTLETLKLTLNQNSWLFLSTEGELFKYLNRTGQ